MLCTLSCSKVTLAASAVEASCLITTAAQRRSYLSSFTVCHWKERKAQALELSTHLLKNQGLALAVQSPAISGASLEAPAGSEVCYVAGSGACIKVSRLIQTYLVPWLSCPSFRGLLRVTVLLCGLVIAAQSRCVNSVRNQAHMV